MSLEEFKHRLDDVKNTVDKIIFGNVSLSNSSAQPTVIDFDANKKEHLKRLYFSSLVALKKHSYFFKDHLFNDTVNELHVDKICKTLAELESVADPNKIKLLLQRMQSAVDQLKIPEDKKLHFKLTKISEEIRSEVFADLDELEKCFNAECYRSAVIIAGRILETALHRKYFEITNNDLLEKAPGIGLGNVIAKMAEQNIKLDPGLPNQIHLINQVRIFSVHKKQEAFCPSRAQTHAIILYTLDVVEKLFGL